MRTNWDWMAYLATIGGQVAFVYEMVEICQKKDGEKLSWPFAINGNRGIFSRSRLWFKESANSSSNHRYN